MELIFIIDIEAQDGKKTKLLFEVLSESWLGYWMWLWCSRIFLNFLRLYQSRQPLVFIEFTMWYALRMLDTEFELKL